MSFSKLSLLILVVSSFACNQLSDRFEEFHCKPAFDFPRKTIFQSCRTFIYEAKYWDPNYNLISKEDVRMISTGNFVGDGGNEIDILVQFGDRGSEEKAIRAFNINEDLKDLPWKRNNHQSAQETDTDVWMHPFRDNQYVFTQVAPYPSVNLPLEAGKKWTSNLIIYEGWGDWNNQQLISEYEVIGEELIDLPFGSVLAWRIHAFLDTPFGIATHDFWYHTSYGFVKMQYTNFEDQLLLFELKAVN